MKIKMTALELIHHLADGATTANTLQHISKIAKATLDERAGGDATIYRHDERVIFEGRP